MKILKSSKRPKGLLESLMDSKRFKGVLEANYLTIFPIIFSSDIDNNISDNLFKQGDEVEEARRSAMLGFIELK